MTKNIAIASLILISTQAGAFTLRGTPDDPAKGWATSFITFDYDYSGCPTGMDTDAMNGVIDAAVGVWNGVPSSSLVVSRGSQVSAGSFAAVSVRTSGNPIVICDPNFIADFCPADGSNGASGSSIGVGCEDNVPAISGSDIGSDGLIPTAYMVLNAQSGGKANVATLLTEVGPTIISIVVAHEMGHAFGLGHSADPNALMYFDASAKKTLALARDDMDGITYLFPRQEPGNGKIFGCATTALVGGGSGSRRGGTGDSGGPAQAETALFFAVCAAISLLARKGLRTSSLG